MSSGDNEWIWSPEHRDYYRYQIKPDGTWDHEWARSTIPPPRTQSESVAPTTVTSTATTVRPSQTSAGHAYASSSSHRAENERSRSTHSMSAHGTDQYTSYATTPQATQGRYSTTRTGGYSTQPGQTDIYGTSETPRTTQMASGYENSYVSHPTPQATSDPSIRTQGLGSQPLAQPAVPPASPQPCYYCHQVTHSTQEHQQTVSASSQSQSSSYNQRGHSTGYNYSSSGYPPNQ